METGTVATGNGNVPQEPKPNDVIDANQLQDQKEEAKQAMVPLAEVSNLVAQEVAKALAAREEAERRAKEEAEAQALEAKKREEEAIAAAKAAEADPESYRYGNQDKRKEFDLHKLLPNQTALPTDKVIIVIQEFRTNRDGTQDEDKTARRAQLIDPADYAQNSKPTKQSSVPLYDSLFRYTLVHQPVA